MENTKITTQTTATPIKPIPSAQETIREDRDTDHGHDLGNEKLLKALYYMYDAFERVNMPWFLVGKTHDAVKNQKDLYGDKVELGVRLNEWTSGGRRILDAFVTPIKEKGDEAVYEYEGVPITIHVYEDSPCITETDTVMYKHEEFHLPNPYNEFERLYVNGK